MKPARDSFVVGPESENLQPAERGAWSSGQHGASGPESCDEGAMAFLV